MAEERITVSRDALRADLAEMELRLRLYFDERLNHKADSAVLAEYALRLEKLDRGEFTDVHRRALSDFFDQKLAARGAVGWARISRGLALTGGIVGITTLVLSILLALHGGTL